MLDRRAFKAGMEAMRRELVQPHREADPDKAAQAWTQKLILWWSMLGPRLTTEQFNRGVERALLSGGQFFPAPGTFLEAAGGVAALEPGGEPVAAEAQRAYELVKAGTVCQLAHTERRKVRLRDPLAQEALSWQEREVEYRTCSCTEERWDPVVIEQRLGQAAARAFREAGGEAEFRSLTEKSEPWVCKRFREGYEREVQSGASRLLTAGEGPKALPAAVGTLPPSREEAAAAMRGIEGKLGPLLQAMPGGRK